MGDSETNELDVNRDIMVLANPEIAGLTKLGCCSCSRWSACCRSLHSGWIAFGNFTAVAHDLMKRSFLPSITERQELLYARIAIFVAVLIAGYVGINPPAYVAQVVAYAFGLAAASFFQPLY